MANFKIDENKNAQLQNLFNNSLKASLHTHSRDSIFDGVSSKQAILDRVKELGGSAVAITNHGVVSDLLDDIDYAKEIGVKVIYGVESYVDYDLGGIIKRTHCILMAIDEIGSKALNDAVTESYNENNLKNGFPCMSEEVLEKHFGPKSKGHGHVIATSACLQGLLGTILDSNSIIDKAIEKDKKLLNELNNSLVTTWLTYEDKDKYDDKGLLFNIDTYNNYYNMFVSLSTEVDDLNKTIDKKSLHLKDLRAVKGKKTPEQKEEISVCSSEIKELKEVLKTKKADLRFYTKMVNAANDKKEKFDSLNINIEQLIKSKRSDEDFKKEAKEHAIKLNTLFGEGNFYIEMQYHWLKKEKSFMPVLAQIAKELSIPLVAANDAHMAIGNEESYKAREVAKFLRFGSLFDENTEEYELASDGSMIVPDKELYIKTDYELAVALSEILSIDQIKEAINNISVIADRCYNYEIPSEKYYPVYDEKLDSNAEIRRLAYEGVKWRFPNSKDFTDEYKKRLEYELDIICSMGYADYHLVVKEYLEFGRLLGEVPEDRLTEAPLTSISDLKAWMKKESETDKRFGIGLGIGEGRGSGAGSLVCYLLGITGIDPIKYNLLFERFLNPERVSMPDIDSDLSPLVRELVIEFVKNKYGVDAVCMIMTKAFSDVKGGLLDASRYLSAIWKRDNNIDDDKYKTPYNKAYNKIAAFMKANENIFDDPSHETSVKELKYNTLFDEYKNYITYDDNNNKIIDEVTKNCYEIVSLGKTINGIMKSKSIHAAGVVIAGNGNVSKVLPLAYNTAKNTWTTQCDMVQVEESGLLKMDFLGLETLKIITNALQLIYKNTGKRIDIRNVINDDEKSIKAVLKNIYEMGNTIGIFQFESPGMRSTLSSCGVDSIEDLILYNAVYRPGPKEYIPVIRDVKNGIKAVSYDHPLMENILKETYGVMVYQEQVMQVCQSLAGYSLGQSDLVRRYMSKKKMSKLEHERHSFVYGDAERNIKGCIANGISEITANKIFDDMIDFAKYAFNKSHAAIYAITSFYTAWLKYYYPYEFYTACLISADKIEKIEVLISDAKNYNINGVKVNIMLPDINKADFNFTTNGEVIYFGLSAIKGLDKATVESIITERNNGNYIDFKDFIKRTGISESALIKLIDAGALDSFGINRKSLNLISGPITELYSSIKSKELFITEGKNVISLMEKDEILTIEDLKELNNKEFKSSAKKLPSIDNFEDKIVKANETLHELIMKFDNFKIYSVIDNTDESLLKEKELLGFCLSKHITDNYSLNTSKINTFINPEKNVIISGVVKKVRKNNYGVFFEIEDTTGSIPCVAWANTFSSDLIEENKVIEISGKTEINKNSEILQFVCEKKTTIKIPERKQLSLLLKVKDIISLLENNEILDEYKNNSDCGCLLYIYDEQLKEIRLYKDRMFEGIINSSLNISVL